MAPLVSILIPAFNTAPYIGTAIESCLAQTRSDLEVIVVDDGSTDGTGDVARRYLSDPRVTVLESDRNGGVSRARNRALTRARGEWVATVDADDWMLPDRLDVLLDAARSYRADLVGDDLLLVRDGEDEPYGTLYEVSGEARLHAAHIDLAGLVDREVGGRSRLRLGLTQPLVRRCLLDQYRIRWQPDLRVGEDLLLYLECVVRGARWVAVPTAHYVYRQRTSSATADDLRITTATKLRACELLIERLRVDLEPDARDLLDRYRGNLARELTYRSVVEPFKRHEWRSTATSFAQHPGVVGRLAMELPAIARRRYNRYVQRDPHAFDMLPSKVR